MFSALENLNDSICNDITPENSQNFIWYLVTNELCEQLILFCGIQKSYSQLMIFHFLFNRKTWENIKGDIKTSVKESLGLYELKQHKPWFDKKCLWFLDQRK
jgi:hypothetical protein